MRSTIVITRIEKILGAEAARLTAQSHTAAIDRIEEIVHEAGIDCEFERLDGYLFFPPGASHRSIEEEYEAALRVGLREIQKLPGPPIIQGMSGPALRFRVRHNFIRSNI